MAHPSLNQITRADVLDAIGRLQAGEAHEFGTPTRYLLEHEGERFAPKAVVGLAARRTHGSDLGPYDLMGGIAPGAAVSILRRLGFRVVDTRPSEPLGDWREFLQVGSTYTRTEIHSSFGGQQQSGIVTPQDGRVILIFSGPAGERYGYRDGWEGDVFWFSEQGQRGDMTFSLGNSAIRDHRAHGKDLLLFTRRSDGQFLFEGPMEYAGHELNRGPDTDGLDRQVIRFELARVLGAPAPNPSQGPNTGAGGSPGRVQDARVRKAIEEHAVVIARRYYEERMWHVETRGKPYDLLCTKDSQTLYVEVKGTTGAGASVILTRNEVEHMRHVYPSCALLVVYGIQVSSSESPITCVGGTIRTIHPWRIEELDLAPLQYDYTLPEE